MIKRNELDVANIDFKLQAERGDKFSRFILFRNSKEFAISQQPDVRLSWDLNQNVVL